MVTSITELMTLQPSIRGDDARGQPVPEPVRANSRGQYDNECSSNEEDRGDVV